MFTARAHMALMYTHMGPHVEKFSFFYISVAWCATSCLGILFDDRNPV